MTEPKLLSREELGRATCDTYWFERLRSHIAALEKERDEWEPEPTEPA